MWKRVCDHDSACSESDVICKTWHWGIIMLLPVKHETINYEYIIHVETTIKKAMFAVVQNQQYLLIVCSTSVIILLLAITELLHNNGMSHYSV